MKNTHPLYILALLAAPFMQHSSHLVASSEVSAPDQEETTLQVPKDDVLLEVDYNYSKYKAPSFDKFFRIFLFVLLRAYSSLKALLSKKEKFLIVVISRIIPAFFPPIAYYLVHLFWVYFYRDKLLYRGQGVYVDRKNVLIPYNRITKVSYSENSLFFSGLFTLTFFDEKSGKEKRLRYYSSPFKPEEVRKMLDILRSRGVECEVLERPHIVGWYVLDTILFELSATLLSLSSYYLYKRKVVSKLHRFLSAKRLI